MWLKFGSVKPARKNCVDEVVFTPKEASCAASTSWGILGHTFDRIIRLLRDRRGRSASCRLFIL